jgi:hypothetical protein
MFIIWGTRNVRSHDEIAKTLSALGKESCTIAMTLKAKWIVGAIGKAEEASATAPKQA